MSTRTRAEAIVILRAKMARMEEIAAELHTHASELTELMIERRERERFYMGAIRSFWDSAASAGAGADNLGDLAADLEEDERDPVGPRGAAN